MFYIINKEKGYSSFVKIQEFAKNIGTQKIGHSGTLDPLASGLLLVATEEDTKLIKHILNHTKTYVVKGHFGFATDTYDILGSMVTSTTEKVSRRTFESKLSKLVNKKSQVPPSFSAKKVKGIRSYELARKGINTKLNRQKINIFHYEIIDFDEFTQEFSLLLQVSAGAYIRSLINDLGEMCKNYATMIELKRVKIGELGIELLKNKDYHVVSSEELFAGSFFEFTYEQAKLLKNGVGFETDKEDGTYFLKNKNNDYVCGIIEIKNNMVRVKKIFPKRLIVENR